MALLVQRVTACWSMFSISMCLSSVHPLACPDLMQAGKSPKLQPIIKCMQVEESSAADMAAIHLAAYYSLGKSKERARSLLERVLRQQPDLNQVC